MDLFSQPNPTRWTTEKDRERFGADYVHPWDQPTTKENSNWAIWHLRFAGCIETALGVLPDITSWHDLMEQRYGEGHTAEEMARRYVEYYTNYTEGTDGNTSTST